ncbi:MAG: SpoIIE family protein phosphatase [Bacteroidales bacterium]|nr:SpoIIE family protein phosphatase [Bacteroidales bacterium]
MTSLNKIKALLLHKYELCVLLLFLLFPEIKAQTGSPLLSNYRESIDIDNQNIAICHDENNVMMFANRRGILTFDGQNWSLIRIPVIPYAMKFDAATNTVFIAGEDSYGYIKKDEKGFYNYHKLSSDSLDYGLLTGICLTDTSVYFFGDECITRYNIIGGKNELYLKAKNEQPFTGMFVTPRNVFINVFSKGLYRLDSDTLFPIVTGYLLENITVLFSLPYDDKNVLLGLDDGRLELFDGIKFYNYPVKDDGYLKQNLLSDGILFSDSLYAFSTLDGGVMVIEKRNGRIKHTINYSGGLPDDEIFAIGKDNSGGLWISHQYGLTRADLRLPVRNLTIYPGLKGNLTCALIYNNEFFTATSEGVFYLTEEKKYVTVEVMEREEPRSIQPGITATPAGQTGGAQQEMRREKRSLLSRIFGKKRESEPNEKRETLNDTISAATRESRELYQQQNQIKPGYVRKTISRLESVDYSFNKVKGLDEKCRQLVTTPNGILASTNKGLALISAHSANIIEENRYVYSITPGYNAKEYWVAALDGYFSASYSDGRWIIRNPDRGFRNQVYSVASMNADTLWMGLDNAVCRAVITNIPKYKYFKLNDDFPQRYYVDYVNDTLFVFSEAGIKYYRKEDESFQIYSDFTGTIGGKFNFILSQPGYPWVNNGDEWICLNRDINISKADRLLLKVFDDIISIFTDASSLLAITGDNKIYRIQRDVLKTFSPDFNLFIKSISNENGYYFNLSDIVLGSHDNNIYFELASPSYIKEKSVQFQYIVDRVMDDWSKWTTASTINLMLQPGKYTLKVRAKDLWGNISEPITINFTIKAPFTRTVFFYLLLSAAGIALIAGIIKLRERRLREDKRILEEKVRERTAEIEAQKEEITSSIEYAGRIQKAMLPAVENFGTYFREYFLIFKPRSIVSGDFYWIGEDENNIYFTVADCTGHGVPGAFMSTLGISALNEIIANYTGLHANEILHILREKIIVSLHQTGKEGEAADGMDIAFCILSKDRKTLQYSGAFNSIFIASNGAITEYRADRMPIGIQVGKENNFTNYVIKVNRGDIVYLFSDGITDQFGGPEGKKFKKKNLRLLLSGISNLPLQEQKIIVEDEFLKWKGSIEQVDDITILGVKI